jgi:integrase
METCPDISPADKQAIGEYLDAIDPENLTRTFKNDDGQNETKSTNTLRTYVYGLKRVAEVSDTPLTELDLDELNELMGGLRQGTIDHDNAKDDGYSKSYLKPWQAALRGFYRYHDDLGVDPTGIVIYQQDRTGAVDERDMYTRDEVQRLRDAVDNARDKCMLELFLNTGQRIRAIQTLRIKDVKPEEGATGVYFLNTDVEGLKNADQNGSKRPLLGEQRSRCLPDYTPEGSSVGDYRRAALTVDHS